MSIAALLCLAVVVYSAVHAFTTILGPPPAWALPLFWISLIVLIVLLLVRNQIRRQDAYDNYYHDTADHG